MSSGGGGGSSSSSSEETGWRSDDASAWSVKLFLFLDTQWLTKTRSLLVLLGVTICRFFLGQDESSLLIGKLPNLGACRTVMPRRTAIWETNTLVEDSEF